MSQQDTESAADTDNRDSAQTGHIGRAEQDRPEASSAWYDTEDYPHRIENHVKVYLHLEEADTGPVLATPATAPTGSRVYRRNDTREPQFGTVTGWTTDGIGVFVSFDEGGTYAGPTFDALWLDSGQRSVARWVVSPVTVDSSPLDGVEDGHYCDYEGHPVGARPDWDRQHSGAAHLDLPTADELLPMLADALGARVIDAESSQTLRVRVQEVLAAHAAWREERAEMAAEEGAGYVTSASRWQNSDDAACDLAERAAGLLTELSGLAGLTGPRVPPAQNTGSESATVALQRSMLRRKVDPGTTSMRPSTEPPAPPSPAPLGHRR